MDLLDGVVATADPLLRRVDQVLSTTGAPPDHPVWPSLRRVRLLPGDAVQAVAALRPADLADAAPELRADARSYAGLADSLPPPTTWTGDAAEAYEAARRRTASHLSGTPDSLAQRLEATADLADALADWMRQARSDLAVTLAEVLTSAEAVSLSLALSAGAVPDPPGEHWRPTPAAATRDARAAADVATRVLDTVADSYAAAEELITATAALAGPQRR
jgi:hypothetical protein